MIVATWNVNGLRARLPFILHWLRSRRPDLVGIQELKLTEEQFPLQELASEGYQALVFGQKAWNGVAILSRARPRLLRKGLSSQPGEEARFLSGAVRSIQFDTLYCPNGKHIEHADFKRKLAWLDTLQEYVEKDLDTAAPIILCGDFNLCPGPIDSWNEEALQGSIFHTEEERSRFHRLTEWGFFDLFREIHPHLVKYSWWDYRGGAFHRNQGLRIDHLLGTRSVLEKVVRVEIDREYRKKKDGVTASDHAPVIAEIRD